MRVTSNKTYSMKDVYREAMQLMRDEVMALKHAPLTQAEQAKLDDLAKTVANEVVNEMGDIN